MYGSNIRVHIIDKASSACNLLGFLCEKWKWKKNKGKKGFFSPFLAWRPGHYLSLTQDTQRKSEQLPAELAITDTYLTKWCSETVLYYIYILYITMMLDETKRQLEGEEGRNRAEIKVILYFINYNNTNKIYAVSFQLLLTIP